MQQNITWTEKYRPMEIEDMALPSEIRDFFSSLLTRKHALPNIILHGPPGSGKTTLALILARKLTRKESVLELNASSDREISAIRGKIKTFAASKSHSGEVKIIIMDECDYLTIDAQHCLRRIIEDTHQNTRFIFITNYVNKVIDPIRSRLVPLYIPWTGQSQSLEVLRDIKRKEQLSVSDENLKYILVLTEGDMRKALVLLQTVGACQLNETDLVDSSTAHRRIIDEISGVIPQEIIESIMSVKTVEEVLETSKSIAMLGYSAVDIVHALSKYLLDKKKITPQIEELFVALSSCESDMLYGGSDFIYLSRVVSSIADIIN
ncbi:replication factor C subunit 2/4, partial [Nematocida ausubeli]